MQFEEFDDKIRQAADHHHPAYDEQAWSKMEKLLDKHLPREEEKKRRFIFFLLFFLLLGGGAWLLISKPWDKEKSKMADKTIASSANRNEKPAGLGSSSDNKPVSLDPRSGRLSEVETAVPENTGRNTTIEKNISNPVVFSAKNPVSNKQKPVEIRKEKKDQNNIPFTATEINKPQPAAENISNPVSVSTEKPLADKNEMPREIINQPKVEKSRDADIIKQIKEVPAPESKTVSVTQNQKTKKTKIKKPNSFFIGLSAGPDLSFVSSDKPGTVKIIGGGGFGFTLHNRVTIRTGFYSGRKVYTASPGSYNPPASWWAYYPNLQKVDADCKVYEIPILLSYNFGHNKTNNWFASAGISTLLMKTEAYNYFYKYTASGPVISKKWTIKDKNKHYFSVLTLSAGFQQKIGKRISLVAEPYIKLPLAGVGFGKVKLNSGGILFTVGVNLFGRQKEETKNLH
ncbi:MAG: hypothetical protein HZB42_03865 [Sphingobacteriales bacterium]|nr:hypothetical protein [Sphingobacteriales bacterium]